MLEYERKRRQMTESAGEKIGKNQSPQMRLSVLMALEYEVREEQQLLFVRTYTW